MKIWHWEEPVTNRTRADTLAVVELLNKNWEEFTADEQAEFLDGMRGALNAADLERVQNNIELLLAVMESENAVAAVPEFPNSAFYTNIKENLTAIHDYPLVYKTTPAVPDLPYDTWDKWNNIEMILKDAFKMVNSFVKYYCGSIYYCGGDIGLID